MSASSLTQGNSNNPPGNNGFSGLALIAGSVVTGLLLLFLGLGLAWRSIRRAFVPLANVKLPPSGALPWSRFRGSETEGFPAAQSSPLADAETEFLPFPPHEPPRIS